MAYNKNKEFRTIPSKLQIQTADRTIKYKPIKRSLMKNIRTIK